MNKTEIIEKLTPIFRKELEKNDLVLTDELSANDVDNWTSLTHMLIMTKIEETFGITFKLKELKKLQNVGDMVSVLEEKTK